MAERVPLTADYIPRRKFRHVSLGSVWYVGTSRSGVAIFELPDRSFTTCHPCELRVPDDPPPTPECGQFVHIGYAEVEAGNYGLFSRRPPDGVRNLWQPVQHDPIHGWSPVYIPSHWLPRLSK